MTPPFTPHTHNLTILTDLTEPWDGSAKIVKSAKCSQVVALHPLARRVWPFLAPELPVGALWGGSGRPVLRVFAEGGGCDPWPPFGHRSTASDPTAGMSPVSRKQEAHHE